jgi:hypothetical protein
MRAETSRGGGSRRSTSDDRGAGFRTQLEHTRAYRQLSYQPPPPSEGRRVLCKRQSYSYSSASAAATPVLVPDHRVLAIFTNWL